MDRISLENFKKEVNQVREYFKHIQYVNDLADYTILKTDNQQIKHLVNKLKEHYISFETDKKVFEYKAAIISLYGLLEKYIETWIKEYLDSLSNLVPKYSEIDTKIRDNHFELSLKLINTIMSRESAKYKNITKEKVLKKLNNCVTNDENYQINAEAFVILSGNLKHNKIVDLFKLLNLDLNAGLIKNEILNNLIGLSPDESSRTASKYDIINDLVERRNTIAHGSEEIEPILSIYDLETYIQFLETYCQAIFETLFEEFIKQESIHICQKIEAIHKILNKSILCFSIENYQIKVGDFLIIETAENRFLKKLILDIQVENVSYSELEITDTKDIAIKIEPTIKDNQTFYLSKKNQLKSAKNHSGL